MRRLTLWQNIVSNMVGSLVSILPNLEGQDFLNCKVALCCIHYLNSNFLDGELNIVTKYFSEYGGVACVFLSSIVNSKHLFMQILNIPSFHLELASGCSNNLTFQTVSNCIPICWLIYWSNLHYSKNIGLTLSTSIGVDQLAWRRLHLKMPLFITHYLYMLFYYKDTYSMNPTLLKTWDLVLKLTTTVNVLLHWKLVANVCPH